MTSKVVTAYRGEHGLVESDNVFETRLGSLSFGSIKAANTYATEPNNPKDTVVSPRIYKAELTFENLAMNEPDDPFIEGFDIINKLGIDKAKEIILDLSDHVFNTDNWNTLLEEEGLEDSKLKDKEILENLLAEDAESIIKKIYLNAYPVFDSEKYVGWYKEKGYDGAIHSGNGETALEPEYKVFDIKQIKIEKIMMLNEKELEPEY